jgi:hypothetical protein
MLGTKTIVYVGYSFSDSDFLKIHEILTSEMKGMRPHSYIVTPDESAKQRFEGKDMTPIITSGSHFLSHLKQHLLNGHMLPDSQFDGLGYILAEIEECHGEISSLHLGKHPTVILTAAYQDGLLHALKRINVQRRTGEYSHICDVSRRIKNYDELRRDRLRQGRYDDVAYIDGYQNGLLLLLASETERKHVPIYYTYGVDEHPRSFRAYKRMLSRAEGIHKAAFKFSQRLVSRKHMDVPGIVYHHTPFL